MNKLDEIHRKPFDRINTFSPYDTNRNCEIARQNILMAEKSAEITTDVAIKFAEFLFAIAVEYQRGGTYVINTPLLDCSITYSLQELFQEFINNHYGK